MDSKQYILDSIRRNTKEVFPRPKVDIGHMVFEDKIQQFKSIIEGVGGLAYELAEGETVSEVVTRLFPDAKRIASNLTEITCATFNPDDAGEPRELNGTDLVVFRGHLGVCENGAVYYEQEYKHRAIYFISEAICVVLDKTKLVDTMHDAYRLIGDKSDREFRGFISGPSKTADIEQSLVMGAHGARQCVIILV
ncbi:LUD domain-containing protein [Porphyromonas sp.]|uniref:LutC/YkgG family protein n=1 Tax=Porphyromonas sp. TaxID=1924944 RepID=UPI0026DCBFC6|nr:LUD domain-containing protein [Porphyromonas sp.]MDO4771144.1 LUD domain-containing protein [Porphyromonas sp.]